MTCASSGTLVACAGPTSLDALAANDDGAVRLDRARQVALGMDDGGPDDREHGICCLRSRTRGQQEEIQRQGKAEYEVEHGEHRR